MPLPEYDDGWYLIPGGWTGRTYPNPFEGDPTNLPGYPEMEETHKNLLAILLRYRILYFNYAMIENGNRLVSDEEIKKMEEQEKHDHVVLGEYLERHPIRGHNDEDAFLKELRNKQHEIAKEYIKKLKNEQTEKEVILKEMFAYIWENKITIIAYLIILIIMESKYAKSL
jgi:hypothetical protein